MEWKLIETKWEAMTRRIRADYPVDQMKTLDSSRGGDTPREAISVSLVDSMTDSNLRPEFKSSFK